MDSFENDNKWNILQGKLQEQKACNAFKYFRENGVEPILIKGFASARWYPSEIGRAYVDVDLCVPANQFEKCKELIASNPPDGIFIDLHKGLSHFDILPWERLFTNSEIFNLDGTEIRLLCPEDHLRVICSHWLIDGGENKQRLWDIFHAVDRRPREFDWEKCLDVVTRNRQKWVIYTIGIAHYYLGLDISGLPFEEHAKRVPKWMKREVEKNWEANIPIVPLSNCKHDKKLLWQQIKKRIPPNPIYSTISMNGCLDAKSRLHYQVGNFLMRSFLAVKGGDRHFLGFQKK